MELALAHGAPLHTPAAVVAQVWRDGRRQARIARLLGSGAVNVTLLDQPEAQAVGVLCERSRTSDVVDASVALVARRHAAKVLTSDPDDLLRVDPALDVALC